MSPAECAISIEGWHWCAHMRARLGEKARRVPMDAKCVAWGWQSTETHAVPDLSDPITLGYLVADVQRDIAVLTNLSSGFCAYLLNGDAVTAPTIGAVAVAVAEARGFWTLTATGATA